MKLNGLVDLTLFLGAYVAIFLGIFSIAYLYRRIRNNGYLPATALLIIALPYAIGIALSSQFLFSQSNERTSQQTDLLIIGAAALSIMLGTSVTYAFPKRANRRSGRRTVRVPFRALSALCAITATLVLVYPSALFHVLGTITPDNQVKLAQSLVAGALLLYAIDKRVRHAPSIEEVRTEDPRPPVVYLRAFNQEEEFFSYGTRSWKEILIGMALRRNERPALSIEEFLGDAIGSQIGPFVALGSPEDYIPPVGAARTYAADNNWQEYFLKLAREASLFVLQVNHSSNLSWELSTLQRMGLERRVVIVTKPDAGIIARMRIRIFRLFRGIEPPPEWGVFVNELQLLGYGIEIPDPGPGAVITFDQDASALVLAQLASTPEEYVSAISSWVCQRKVLRKDELPWYG